MIEQILYLMGVLLGAPLRSAVTLVGLFIVLAILHSLIEKGVIHELKKKLLTSSNHDEITLLDVDQF